VLLRHSWLSIFLKQPQRRNGLGRLHFTDECGGKNSDDNQKEIGEQLYKNKMGLVDGKAAQREDGDVARASQQIAAHRQETAAVDDFLLAADWFHHRRAVAS
jgi:hypothetical protein